MTQSRNNATKTRGRGPGRPFQRGNPGRPKGARHRATLAAEALLDGEAEGITRKAFAEAMANHGFAPTKSQQIRGYSGLNLKPGERDHRDFN